MIDFDNKSDISRKGENNQYRLSFRLFEQLTSLK